MARKEWTRLELIASRVKRRENGRRFKSFILDAKDAGRDPGERFERGAEKTTDSTGNPDSWWLDALPESLVGRRHS